MQPIPVFWQNDICERPHLDGRFHIIDVTTPNLVLPDVGMGTAIMLVSIENRRRLEKAGFYNGLSENTDSYTYSRLMAVAGHLLFSQDPALYPFGYIRRSPPPGPRFIKPNSGSKIFSGQIITSEDIQAISQISPINDDDLIVVSTPRDIMGEMRYVLDIEQRKIIGHSAYWHDYCVPRSIVCPEDLISETMKTLSEAFCPEILVADFAMDNENRFGLLEINCISTSGLYGIPARDVCNSLYRFVM